MASDVQSDIDMIIQRKNKECAENLLGNSKDKIKNIIKKEDYHAIMDMKNKLKDFFEFPFKYFKSMFKKLFVVIRAAKRSPRIIPMYE